ncbi:MAG: carbohydrate kinase family protein [bacterium]
MTKSGCDIVSIGSLSRDIFTRAENSRVLQLRSQDSEESLLAFEYGAKLDVREIALTLGGGGSNTAVSFSRMGLKSGIIGMVGADSLGDEIVAHLLQEGVMTDHVERSKQEKTGLSIVLNSFEGERTILVYRGANVGLKRHVVDWNFASGAKWVYLSSLPEQSESVIEVMPDFLRQHGIKLAWNPGGVQVMKTARHYADLLAETEVLLLNKEEATIFSGRKPNYQVSAVEHHGSSSKGMKVSEWQLDLSDILKALHAFGPKIIAITDGKKGTQVFDGKTLYSFGIYPQQVVDTLGAGDAFGSGFVTGLFLKNDIEYGMQLGTANAASVVSKYGAQDGLLKRGAADRVIGENRGLEILRGKL